MSVHQAVSTKLEWTVGRLLVYNDMCIIIGTYFVVMAFEPAAMELPIRNQAKIRNGTTEVLG